MSPSVVFLFFPNHLLLLAVALPLIDLLTYSFLCTFSPPSIPFSSAIFYFPPVCPSSHLCFYYLAHHVFQINFLIRPYSISPLCLSAFVCSLCPHLCLSTLVSPCLLPPRCGVTVLLEYSSVTTDCSKCHSTVPWQQQLSWQSKQ